MGALSFLEDGEPQGAFSAKFGFPSNALARALGRAGEGKDASGSPEREPSRLAARRNTQGGLKGGNILEPSWPLRAGTARGPTQSLMQPCGAGSAYA